MHVFLHCMTKPSLQILMVFGYLRPQYYPECCEKLGRHQPIKHLVFLLDECPFLTNREDS